jgi:hypothetical protein
VFETGLIKIRRKLNVKLKVMALFLLKSTLLSPTRHRTFIKIEKNSHLKKMVINKGRVRMKKQLETLKKKRRRRKRKHKTQLDIWPTLEPI